MEEGEWGGEPEAAEEGWGKIASSWRDDEHPECRCTATRLCEEGGESSSSPTAEENGSNGVEEEVAAVNGNGDAGGASSGAAAMEQVEVEEEATIAARAAAVMATPSATRRWRTSSTSEYIPKLGHATLGSHAISAANGGASAR